MNAQVTGGYMQNVSYLAERLANLQMLYHHQVYPLSEDAKKGLLKRIKRLHDALEPLLAAEGKSE